MSQQQNDDFNTEALFKEVNNVIQRGLSEILENHKLYEATHNALMNLPSIKQEFSKYKEKEDKEKQKEQEIANWWNIIRSNENNSYFTSKYSCDNNKNNGDDDDMPELISCSEAGEDVKQLVKRVVEEEIHASNNKMHEVLNTTFVSLFQELKELKEEIRSQKIIDLTDESEIEIKVEKEKEIEIEKENIVLEILESEVEDESDEEAEAGGEAEADEAEESDEEAAEDEVAIEDEGEEGEEEESDEEDQVAIEDEAEESEGEAEAGEDEAEEGE